MKVFSVGVNKTICSVIVLGLFGGRCQISVVVDSGYKMSAPLNLLFFYSHSRSYLFASPHVLIQLQGEVEVLHTAKVRHDWRGGGKLELSVRQGESVEILRVKNNPGGKWLARSLTGSCEFPFTAQSNTRRTPFQSGH